jgi:beta-galactosidase
LGPLLRSLYTHLGVEKAPETPAGVCARVVEGRAWYVNTTGTVASVSLAGDQQGLLSGKRHSGILRLEPHAVDLLE